VSSARNEIDEIRRQMAQIRHDLHEDVCAVVSGAEGVTDWRRYVRAYPWLSVALVMGAGYLVVPRSRRSVPVDIARQADVAEVRDVLKHAQQAPGAKEERRKSLVGAALAMAAPFAWRVAQNYALAYIEQWIAQQQQQHHVHTGPQARSPEESGKAPFSGRPNGPGRPWDA
jgi:hypothetical protein